jgi:GntR family transcriptional regulator
MLVTLDPSDARPIYVQIMDEIRRAIVLGQSTAGDPVPSVRQLAVDLRVNPNTVSQAYRELEREGVVETRRGQGTFVAKSKVSARQLKTLAHDVAERAVRDAFRNGLTVEELIDAIRREGSDDLADRRRA